jgi:ABC-type Fe3+-hydroxamate transport system substrate-binding protein
VACFTDDLGTEVEVPCGAERVVSLVPSLTESIAATRPGALVAATQWCIHPADLAVERVRGTKNPDVRRIVELAPDLVVANKEENRRIDVERLRAAGVPVWVTVTETVPGALASLRRMIVQALGWDEPGWLAECEHRWGGPVPPESARVAIPIWRDPWMVVGRDTFTGDLAARLGLRNVFADHAVRYPHVTIADVTDRRPDVVLLPDEPYRFTADDGPDAFPDLPCALVDGRALTWYGPSLLTARDTITNALARAAP